MRVLLPLLLAVGCGKGTEGPIPTEDGTEPDQPTGSPTGPTGTPGGTRNPVCDPGTSAGEVQAPRHVAVLDGQTGWFASPVVADLDGDGDNELVAAFYDLFVYDGDGRLLDRTSQDAGRVYAPHVVADIDGDGALEVVIGRDHLVVAYAWVGGALAVEPGWPADTTSAGSSPEVRGMAAADLDGDGTLEIAVTTTQTEPTEAGGAQVFVFASDGSPYQPAGGHAPAWPRYNALSGPGNDADRNGMGHHGYGCYGLNVGLGDVDGDPELEVVTTYDNHHIQVFDHDGVALDSAPFFTNRDSDFAGQRLTWGQFIRWADPDVERAHYHDHVGDWPHPSGQEWLQWTASPPSVADLDGDGRNEVIGLPNVELHEPYQTQAYAVMVLDGNYEDGQRGARRKAGWEELPRGDFPIEVEGWYPPLGVPAPTLVDLQGDAALEIIAPTNDGLLRAWTADAQPLWTLDHTHGQAISFASEATVADLNQDGSPEVLFTTFGDPDVDAGWLMIAGADGTVLHDVPLPNPGRNGNGNGAPASPAVGDLDGDGQLDVFVQTFDHGIDVFTVPGSAPNCVLWSTARGGPRRTGAAHVD